MNTKQIDALKLARDFISAEWGFGGTTDIEPSKLVRMLDEALAEQPAQQQEPFAYAYTGIKHNGEHHGPHLVWKPEYMDAMSASMGAVAVPLYTSPPASKPLTDEQIMEMYNEPRSDAEMIEFARAIEAAHGIKGDA